MHSNTHTDDVSPRDSQDDKILPKQSKLICNIFLFKYKDFKMNKN